MNAGYAHYFCDSIFQLSQLYAFDLTHAGVQVVGFAHEEEGDEVAHEEKVYMH